VDRSRRSARRIAESRAPTQRESLRAFGARGTLARAVHALPEPANMTDSTDRPEDSARRRFLEQAGALVAAAPLAAALHAAVQVEDAATATTRKAKPAPKVKAATPDPFPGALPDVSLCRNAEERALLEKQWKGMVDVVKVIRDAPLDPAGEPVTVFAALPREA
jgi:hypothetical protein